jgi:RNA polymerase sigma-70 factor (ECF subfamily)
MSDDAALIRRCQAGDMAAFETLFQTHARPVLQLAYLITRDQAAAEDVLQESFAHAFRSIGQLRDPRAFRSWLHQIAVREARRAVTRTRAERARLVAAHRHALGVQTAPQDDVVRRQLLWDAMGRLPEQQRTALVLHYYHDQTVADVARLMDCSPGTVKSWLARARATLARYLGASAGELGGDPTWTG